MITVGAAASHIKSGESVTESVGLAFDLASPATLLGLELLMLVTATDEFSITYWLEPKPAEVRHAREQVRKALPGWGLGASTDLAELIVSELVTNALRHSDHAIQVSLCYDGRDLWIEVWDGGDGRPVRLEPGSEDERGRGIQLIDSLIELCGGTRGTADCSALPGKTVYVAFPVQPGQASTPL
jgi:Histidine kinase-like ATPase domain